MTGQPAFDWIPCEESEFYWMLGCLPPEDRRHTGFLVGEASDHRLGVARFQAYYSAEDDRYFKSSAPLTITQFRSAMDEIKAAAEV